MTQVQVQERRSFAALENEAHEAHAAIVPYILEGKEIPKVLQKRYSAAYDAVQCAFRGCWWEQASLDGLLGSHEAS